jgi:hypothetical protein
MATNHDWNGINLQVESVTLGGTKPGSPGSATVSSTELNFLDSVTAGTAAANKAVVLDGSKGITTITSATITTLTSTTGNVTTVNATNVDAGASGTAGSVDVFPATAANGKIIISAINAGGAYNTTITNSTMGQSSTISIPDPGAATSKFVLQDGTNTSVTATTVNATNLQINSVAVSSTAAEIDRQCDISAQTETIDTAGVVSVTKRLTKIDNTVGGAGAITLAAPDASSLGQIKIVEMTVDGGDITLSLANVQGGTAATTATFGDVNDCLTLVGGTNKWHVLSESGVVLS